MSTDTTLDIRERAREAYHSALRAKAHQEALAKQEAAQRGAQSLREALHMYLDIDIAAADPVVELDGVRFTSDPVGSAYPLLYAILPCEECGQDVYTDPIQDWADLGDVLSRPPLHRGCPAAAPGTQATPTIEERLIEALRELVREEMGP